MMWVRFTFHMANGESIETRSQEAGKLDKFLKGYDPNVNFMVTVHNSQGEAVYIPMSKVVYVSRAATMS